MVEAVGADLEGEGQRRRARSALRAGCGLRARPGLQEDEPDDDHGRDHGRRGGEGDDAGPGRHAVTVAVARSLYSGK